MHPAVPVECRCSTLPLCEVPVEAVICTAWWNNLDLQQCSKLDLQSGISQSAILRGISCCIMFDCGFKRQRALSQNYVFFHQPRAWSPSLEAYALTNHHWSTLHLFPHYSLTDLSSASGFLPVHHTVCYVSIHFLKGTWPELVGICGTDWAQQFFRFKAASQIKSSRVYLLRSGDSVKQSPGVAVCLFQRMEQWDTVVD